MFHAVSYRCEQSPSNLWILAFIPRKVSKMLIRNSYTVPVRVSIVISTSVSSAMPSAPSGPGVDHLAVPATRFSRLHASVYHWVKSGVSMETADCTQIEKNGSQVRH